MVGATVGWDLAQASDGTSLPDGVGDLVPLMVRQCSSRNNLLHKNVKTFTVTYQLRVFMFHLSLKGNALQISSPEKCTKCCENAYYAMNVQSPVTVKWRNRLV